MGMGHSGFVLGCVCGDGTLRVCLWVGVWGWDTHGLSLGGCVGMGHSGFVLGCVCGDGTLMVCLWVGE